MEAFISIIMLVTVCILSYIIYAHFDLMYESETLRSRIIELSGMLQIAEYKTGKPYYSSLHNKQTKYEYPQWLYTHIREKLTEEMLDTPISTSHLRSNEPVIS